MGQTIDVREMSWGFFEPLKQQRTAVAERPGEAQDLKELLMQPNEYRTKFLPVPVKRKEQKTGRGVVGDGRIVTHKDRAIAMLPGIWELSGRSVKELLGIPYNYTVFLDAGNGWRRLADQDVIRIRGGENFRSEAPPPPPPRSSPAVRVLRSLSRD